MANPEFKIRQPQSGPTVEGMTPGFVLKVQADGASLKAEPGGGGGTVEVGDIDATGVPDGYVIAAFGEVAQWAPVPTAFAIGSFAHAPTLLQVGATATNPAFTASYNQAATSASLTDTEGHNDALTLPATAFISPHAFTKNVFGQSVTFTLHAAGALGTATAALTIAWGELVFFGAANDPGTYNEAFIESLGSTLKLGAGGAYNLNAAGGQSSFFCALTSLGLTTANFFVGGFPFACSRVATGVNVTNVNGITETFDVFRSDNVGLGAFTLTVQ